MWSGSSLGTFTSGASFIRKSTQNTDTHWLSQSGIAVLYTGMCVSSSWEPISQLRSVTCHIGSHKSYLNVPCLTPAKQTRTWFTYPGGIKGWVDLGGWLYTEMVYLSADSHHPSSNHLIATQLEVKKKVKERIALYGEIHDRATERHLPYWITVLPATRHRWGRPALTPAMQAGTRFTYPGGMEGWVDLVTRKRRRLESNSRPVGPESNALTTEPPSNSSVYEILFLIIPRTGLHLTSLNQNTDQPINQSINMRFLKWPK